LTLWSIYDTIRAVNALSVPSRSYNNALREEQAAQTRARILEAAVELLAENGDGEIVMPQVAERAGVSLRTVYRNFPTRDALLDAVAEWITERFAARMGGFPHSRDEYVAMAPLLGLVFELEPLYRALFATAAGRAAHIRSNADRNRRTQLAFASELVGVSAAKRRRFAALMHLLQSSNGALFLHDYSELSADDSVRAMRWAASVLADAVTDPDRRKDL
jgi:AcrR family transcriptional regulator